MAEEQTAPTPRRRGRPPGSRTGTTRRRPRLHGPELVDNLNEMVTQLIKENRRLKRQLDKLTSSGTAAASGAVESALRTLQRRVSTALGGGTTQRRRRSGTSATTARRRRRPSAES